MLAEWSAECGADAPSIVVPWSDPATGAAFIDLRQEPLDVAEIPEAEHHPALSRSLRALNATRSPFFTSKCDTWTLTPQSCSDHLMALRLELDLEPELAACGLGSYIDLVWRERSVFASAHQQSERLDRVVRRVARLAHDQAALHLVLRPALFDRGAPLEGYATTMYLTGLGPDSVAASFAWESALTDVVEILRSRELEIARGSATIDLAPPPAGPRPGPYHPV